LASSFNRFPAQTIRHASARSSSSAWRVKMSRSQTSPVCAAVVVAATAVPTVADTKRKFLEGYTKPIPSLYSTVIQELLVQHHIVRYNSGYKYDPIIALGFVSVFDQVTEGLDKEVAEAVFKAYIEALNEDPAKYRADAEKMQEVASSSSLDDFKPDESGNELQKALAQVANNSKYYYCKWFGIGIFRLLEIADAMDPKALESLVTSLGVRIELVQRDLALYKGVLSKMSAARELMEEMMAREKKKQAERDSAKAAKEEAEPAGDKSEDKEKAGASQPES